LFLIVMSPEIVLNLESRSYIAGATFLGDGNDFALSVCVLLPMTLALVLKPQGRFRRLTTFGIAAMLLLAIVGSQSRGGTLGVIAVAGYLWMTSKRKLASLIGIVVAAVIIALFASDAYFSRMSTIRNYQSEGSAEGRIIAWKASVRMAMSNPLLGVGLGNFPTEFGSKYRPSDRGMPWMTAHSSYFLVLGELGLPGVIVFLALVFGGLRATLAVKRRLIDAGRDPPSLEVSEVIRLLGLLAASAVGFAVPGAFLSAAYYPHIFVLTGILVSARCIALGLLATPTRNSTGRAGGRTMSHSVTRTV
jgi:putative inorganic carbon (HCO3(-)) transporter